MTNETNCGDPIVMITVWRGPRSALAALTGIPNERLRSVLARHGFRRHGAIDFPITSPVAMRTLRNRLARPDDDP